MKEAFLKAQDELIGEYMDQHPDATEEQAERAIEHRVHDHMVETLCDRADRLLDREKYERR